MNEKDLLVKLGGALKKAKFEVDLHEIMEISNCVNHLLKRVEELNKLKIGPAKKIKGKLSK